MGLCCWMDCCIIREHKDKSKQMCGIPNVLEALAKDLEATLEKEKVLGKQMTETDREREKMLNHKGSGLQCSVDNGPCEGQGTDAQCKICLSDISEARSKTDSSGEWYPSGKLLCIECGEYHKLLKNMNSGDQRQCPQCGLIMVMDVREGDDLDYIIVSAPEPYKAKARKML